MQTTGTTQAEPRRNPIRFWLKQQTFGLRLWWRQFKDNALLTIGNRLPPTIKYYAAVMLHAEVSVKDLPETAVPEICAMDSLKIYAKRHGIH